MDNPKNLRLWDCAVCNEEGEDRAIYPPDLQTARQPGGIPQFPPGVSKMGSARFGMLERIENIPLKLNQARSIADVWTGLLKMPLKSKV
jgi:hypothetical protein